MKSCIVNYDAAFVYQEMLTTCLGMCLFIPYFVLLIGRWQKKDDPNTILTIDSEKCILDSNGTLTERFYSVKGEGDTAYLYMNDYYGYPTLEHVDYYTLILAWNKRFSGTYQRIQN